MNVYARNVETSPISAHCTRIDLMNTLYLGKVRAVSVNTATDPTCMNEAFDRLSTDLSINADWENCTNYRTAESVNTANDSTWVDKAVNQLSTDPVWGAPMDNCTNYMRGMTEQVWDKVGGVREPKHQ